jgi:hypothetical protein
MSQTAEATVRGKKTKPAAAPATSSRAGMAKSGLAAFFRIAEAWQLPAADQLSLLGNPSRSTLYNWKAGKSDIVSGDTLERLSYVLGIFRALEVLIPSHEHANAWVTTPNDAPLFGGQPPLAFLRDGGVASLYRVRAYLDAQRGGWA